MRMPTATLSPAALVVWILTCACPGSAAPARSALAAPHAPRFDSTVTLLGHRYDLSRTTDIDTLSTDLDRLTALAKAQHEARKAAHKAGLAKPVLPKGQRYLGAKKTRHALRFLRERTAALRLGKAGARETIRDIQDVAWALDSRWTQVFTWRPSLDIMDVPLHSRNLTLNAVGRGSSANPARDLSTYSAPDLSLVDPLPSPFWSRPQRIADRDLYDGFGRQAIPRMDGDIVPYARAHSGYGTHAIFQVKWRGERWKIKFGEQHTEPFATRIFWALGFPVYPTDWVPEVKVRYDRRILSELNRRRDNTIRLKLAGITLTTFADHVYHDPFSFIRYAVLKDGTRLTAAALRRDLFRGVRVHHPELQPKLYDTAFESKIDYLVMPDANIRCKSVPGEEDLGFWDYNSYQHPQMRALRGMGLLHAWLDSWDVRWGNNRLRLVDNRNSTQRVEEPVSDLGTDFGDAAGLLRFVKGSLVLGLIPNSANPYAWSFTRPLKRGQTAVPICDYMPMARILPFYDMNIDDARWMARLIAQLTENQLREALIAAGYQAPEARLLLEKLVSRRDCMVQDLGLVGEIPLLRPHGVDKRLNYDPRKDGPFQATLPSGTVVTARDTGEWLVRGGYLRRRPAARAKSYDPVPARSGA